MVFSLEPEVILSALEPFTADRKLRASDTFHPLASAAKLLADRSWDNLVDNVFAYAEMTASL